MTNTTSPSILELWSIVKKEITGIQLLWETANGLYFQPHGRGVAMLEQAMPTLFRLAQTVLMESLLMRVSRLMDPAYSGWSEGDKPNLSLKRLVATDHKISCDEEIDRKIWETSSLKTVRDKYLSHNDLGRASTAEHTLNIPLTTADIEALQALVNGLRELRRCVNLKLAEAAYLDEHLDLQVRRELGGLGRLLLGGGLFFELLPDHEVLQRAWQETGHA